MDKGGSLRRDVACIDSFHRFEKLRSSLTDFTPVNGETGRLYPGNNGVCPSEERGAETSNNSIEQGAYLVNTVAAG